MTPQTRGSAPTERIAFQIEQQPGHAPIWWGVCELPDHHGWLVAMRFETTTEGSRLRELKIVPESEDAPIGATTTFKLGFGGGPPRTQEEITTRMLRRVPTQALRSAVEQKARRLTPEAANRVMPEHRRPGRPGRPDGDYAVWASKYVDLLAGGSSEPVKDLALSEHLSPSQIRGIIHEARRRGLLTSTPQGRAGGDLTQKALQMLGTKED